jgi:hypothetical protein
MTNAFRGISTSALQCPHTSTISELLPPESTHYGKLKCGNCGIFLKFLPRPENEQRRIINCYRLAKLQMCDRLNSFEREFVDSLAKIGNNKFSPKQQAVFDRLCLTYLEGRAG